MQEYPAQPRCKHWGVTFLRARTAPEGRKGCRDKRVCDDACRQAQHRSKKKGYKEEA
jgi:hypothetical protein